MKIDFKTDEARNSLIGSAVLSCMGDLMDKKTGDDLVERYHNDGFLTVKFSVNGVECDINKVLESWNKQFEYNVKIKAKELAEKKLNEAFRILELQDGEEKTD